MPQKCQKSERFHKLLILEKPLYEIQLSVRTEQILSRGVTNFFLVLHLFSCEIIILLHFQALIFPPKIFRFLQKILISNCTKYSPVLKFRWVMFSSLKSCLTSFFSIPSIIYMINLWLGQPETELLGRLLFFKSILF